MTCPVCNLLVGPSPRWTDGINALLQGLRGSEPQLHLFTEHLLGEKNLLLEFARRTWNQTPNELIGNAAAFLEPNVLGSILRHFGRDDPQNPNVQERRARVEQVWRGLVVTIQCMPALARRPTDAAGLAKQFAQAARHFQKAWQDAWPLDGPASRPNNRSFAEQLNMPLLDEVLNEMARSPRVNDLGALAVERLVRYVMTTPDARVAPTSSAVTTILFHDPSSDRGRSARLTVTAWPFGVAAFTPDPVTTGIVYLGPAVLASMAHAWTLLAPKQEKRPDHALLIGISDLPDHRVDGESAGVALYCAMRAALFGQQLDADKAVSARLPDPASGPLRSVGHVNEKLSGLEGKDEAQPAAIRSQISAAQQRDIREVILCRDDHRQLETWGQSVGAKVRPAATLEIAYRLLRGDARIRRALERYRRNVRAWSRRKLDQACRVDDARTSETEAVGYIVPETAIAPAGLNPFTHVPERVRPSGPEKGTEESRDPYDAIEPAALLVSAGERVCLTEDSGLGKTVFLLWAQGELNSPELDGAAVSWRASAVRWESKDDVLQRLGNDLMRLHSGLTTRRANRIARWLLDQGKVTFLIDALDQTNDEHARALAEFLDETGAGHACRVILTSRPYAVRENRGKLFDPDGLGRLTWRFAKLKPFDEPRQRRFLGTAYQQIHSPKEIQDLLGVPMVLRMLRELAIDGRLGALRSRADVYHAAMLALVERGIRTLNGVGTLEPDRAEQILAAIAFQMALDGNFDCQVDGVAVGSFFRRVKNLLGQDAPTHDEWKLVRRLNIATDRSILEGLSRESIGFRHRSVMEFFAGQYLASYADGDRIPAPLRRRLSARLRRQASSEDWYWVWRFAIDMPATARDPAISRRTLRVLFRRSPPDVPRPCELIYRAWDLMNRLPGGPVVLRSFQSEFRAMINDVKDPGHAVASALDTSFVRCPDKPSLDNQPFLMGSPDHEKGRGPDETQHRVTVTPFLMGRFAVTNRQYELFDPAHGARRWGLPAGSEKHPDNDDECPVVHVSWYDAWAFCRWLGDGYGLPTEAQREYACRAGTTTAFHYGDSLSSTQANFDGNYPYGKAKKGPYHKKTTPVGSYRPPNAWGLFDVHGNVLEWCADWYDENYYSRSPERDPTGPETGDRRVLRGGSWYFDAGFARSALRDGDVPDFRNSNFGFRVLCSSCVRTP